MNRPQSTTEEDPEMLAFVERNGPPEALLCPVFLCDQRLAPIQGKDGGDGIGGLVQWRRRPDGTQEVATLHKGRCTRAFEAAHPGERWLWNEMPQVIDQLAFNTAEPFPVEDNVEFVAPAASTWRRGEYRRR